MLPFSYAARNLLRDPARLAQTVAGSFLVVFLVFAAGAFHHGMDSVLRASGSPHNVILLGAGSEESVERSEIKKQAEILATAAIGGIEQQLGQPAVSGEVHYMGNLTASGHRPAQALLRGVTPAALAVHPDVRFLTGQFPQAGQVMVGRLAHHTLGVPSSALEPGSTLSFEGQVFTVAGAFAAPGTVMESEVWMNRTDLMTLTQRETLSCVVLRLTDPKFFASADLFSKQRLDLELVALPESAYYARLSRFFGPIRAMTWLTALLIAAGAVFGGINMLFAAFASRLRELATLQAVGFTRAAIFISLIQESLLATLLGTLLASWTSLLLDGVSIRFSLGAFQLGITGPVALSGLLTGLLLGLLGAIPPALRCLTAPLPAALRS